MSCKNSNRSQLCCRVLTRVREERERERKKMVKGNDGCGMKQARKKSACKTGTQFRIEQLIVLKTAADHVILYGEATKELLLFSACDFRTIRCFFLLPQPERISNEFYLFAT